MKSITLHDRPYRSNTTLTCISINVVMTMGGLGDMIARVPAIRYMLKHNPHISIKLWCPEYFIELAETFFIDEPRLQVTHIDKYKSECNWDEPMFDFTSTQHTSFATNLTKHAFDMLVNKELPYPSHDVYEYPRLNFNTHINTPWPYVVITTNYTAPVRRFMQPELEKLLDYFLVTRSMGVYILGKANTPVRAAKGLKEVRTIDSHTLDLTGYTKYDPYFIDLRDKTTLLESAHIIYSAKAILGIDNGLIHLAGCTNTPIIAGFTSVAPYHRVITRNGIPNHNIATVGPDPSLQCRYCQSNMGLIYGHRFKYCMYDDYLCCEQISAEKFIIAYERLCS